MRSIFPYIFIALSVALFIFIARPLYADVTKLRADILDYNVALTHSTDLKNVRNTLASKYANISLADKTRLVRFLPNTVDNIQLILELEQMAASRGMSLKNITFVPPQSVQDPKAGATNNKLYGVFDLQFKTQTTYENFNLFLKDIEHNLRLIDVRGISFGVNDVVRFPGLDPSTYEYTVKIQTYWLK